MASLNLRRRGKCEQGAELVEFALALPLLLLIVLGILDFGLLFQRYEVLTNAAREGARVAILPGYVEADAQFRATQYLTASGVTTPAPTFPAMTSTAVNIGGVCMTLTTFSVSYQHNYIFLGGIIQYFGESLVSKTLTATAQMRSETPAAACP